MEKSSENTSEICSGAVDTIFRDINELVTIDNLVIGVYDEIDKKLDFSWYKDCNEEILAGKLERSYMNMKVIYDEGERWLVFPLRVDSPNGVKCIGVMGLECDDKQVREEDRILLELVSEYLGVALYHTIVQVEKRFQDIELAKDEAARAEHEDNMLHVQNLVLDNCLSTIKHETIYYPGRLRKMVEQIRNGNGENNTSLDEDTIMKSIKDMDELVNYYKEIFTLLSSCAMRMLEEITFRRAAIEVSDIVAYAEKYYRKSVKRLKVYPMLNVDIKEHNIVIGDDVLLRFMFENLIDEALRYESEGEINISVRRDDSFVRFDFIDKRRNFTQEELNLLFYPDNAKVTVSDDGNVLSGAEYLVCKQIIRDHDEFGGRRGCRINANVADDGIGFCVWFTLPSKNDLTRKVMNLD